MELPIGEVLVRATFTPAGRFAGDLELWYGDIPVGRGHIPQTTPLTYGVDPFAVGYQRMTPIAPTLRGTAAITPGVLDHVVVEVAGKAYRDPQREDRAASPCSSRRSLRRRTPPTPATFAERPRCCSRCASESVSGTAGSYRCPGR